MIRRSGDAWTLEQVFSLPMPNTPIPNIQLAITQSPSNQYRTPKSPPHVIFLIFLFIFLLISELPPSPNSKKDIAPLFPVPTSKRGRGNETEREKSKRKEQNRMKNQKQEQKQKQPKRQRTYHHQRPTWRQRRSPQARRRRSRLRSYFLSFLLFLFLRLCVVESALSWVELSWLQTVIIGLLGRDTLILQGSPLSSFKPESRTKLKTETPNFRFWFVNPAAHKITERWTTGKRKSSKHVENESGN